MKTFLLALITIPVSTFGFSLAQSPAFPNLLKPNLLFRIHGSNTIGAELAPALAEAFLRQRGAGDIHFKASTTPGLGFEIGTMPDDIGQVAIEINLSGSAIAPAHLASGSADIGMMSRKMTSEETARLALLGDLQSSGAENVLGMDGIAVVVNRSNPVCKLPIEQLRQIFAGQVTNWKDVGGVEGPIKLYGLPESSSGTYRIFEDLALKPEKLSASVKQVPGSRLLAELIAHDPAGIGFVGMPFSRSAKALGITITATDNTQKTVLPTVLTVSREEYPFTRRLYMYLPPKCANTEARQFAAFAMSDAGQKIVEKNGFVSARLREERTKRQNVPKSPLIELAFRFRDSSTQLDDKALADLDRLVDYVYSLDHPPTLLLIGHSDNLGSEENNVKISKERAKVVADELRARGIDIAGTGGQGSKSPVASNDTPEGRQLNRRVEIWSRM